MLYKLQIQMNSIDLKENVLNRVNYSHKCQITNYIST